MWSTAKEARLEALLPQGIEFFQLLLDSQEALNDRVVMKDAIHPVTDMAFIRNQPPTPQGAAIKTYWACQFARALTHEVVEFENSFPWKWWSKNRVIDDHNSKVELADMLHFYMSMCLAVGLDASALLSAYRQKLAINHQRQDKGYNDRNKTEADNQTIKV